MPLFGTTACSATASLSLSNKAGRPRNSKVKTNLLEINRRRGKMRSITSSSLRGSELMGMHHRFPLWGGSLIFLPPQLSIRDPHKSTGAQTALSTRRSLISRALKAINSVGSRISQFTKLTTKSGINPLVSVIPAMMNSTRSLFKKINKKVTRRETPNSLQRCSVKVAVGYNTIVWKKEDSVTTAAWSTSLLRLRYSAGKEYSLSLLMTNHVLR
jgi:hypothetical protein